MHQIKDWLNSNRNYDAGVALLQQYSDDRQLKELFKEYRTPFKEKKLVDVLKSLITVSAKLLTKTTEKQEQLKTETHGWPPAGKHPQLDALKAIWQPLYKEQQNLCARLYDVARLGQDDKNKEIEAGQMAHRILALRDEIKDLYFQRDHYLQYGHLPGKKHVFTPVVDDIKIAERRLTVRRYLTRLKNALDKNTGSPVVRLKQEKDWSKYVAEMKYINEKLNRPENEGIPARQQQVANG